MISLFKYYNIKPIFIFDGKIDIDKMETINKRRNEKIIAHEKYNNLILENDPKCKMMVDLKKNLHMFLEICLMK